MNGFLPFFKEIPLYVLITIVVYILALVVQTKLIKQNKLYTKGRRRIEIAIKNGRVITATLDHIHTRDRKEGWIHYGVYKYQFKNRTYSKSIKGSARNFSQQIHLYYDHRPSNAKTASELTYRDQYVWPRLVPFLLAILAGMLTKNWT